MKVKFALTLLLLCIVIGWATAQPYPTNNNVFQVSQIKGCAPLTVDLTVPTALCDPPNSSCDFFFLPAPATSMQNTFTFPYDVSGVYNLIGVFQGGVQDQVTITVVENTPPVFEIYTCSTNQIQVKITDTKYDQYLITYSDGSPVVTVPKGNLARDTHSFATPGGKTVTVRGRNLNADDNCVSSVQTVDALTAIPAPTISLLTVLNDRDIQLDFATRPNILYHLEIAVNSSTNFQKLKDVYGTNTTVANNLRPDDNYYCFRLGAFDPCNNLTYYSNTICSSNLDVIPQNNNNRLTWVTSSSGVVNYTMTKNPGTPLNAASSATFFNDPNTICGTEYCYQLTTNYSGAQSISLLKCATAISTDIPTVVENISTIVGTNSTVELRWTQDPAFNATAYLVTTAVNGTFAERDTVATPTFTDDAYASDATSCYTINYDDACANKSPVSVEVCPIILMGALQEDNAVSLSWNGYNGWRNGVDNYIVEKFSDQGQLLRTFNAGVNTTYVDNTQDLLNQVALYRITAVANDGGIVSSVSNTITVIKDPNLFYPTAFTPNADRLNDIFNVFGQYITNFEMRIFNRWGEMMYATEDIDQGWNGFYKGTLMPEGTYVFRATITDQAGRTFDRSGTVLLLRKN